MNNLEPLRLSLEFLLWQYTLECNRAFSRVRLPADARKVAGEVELSVKDLVRLIMEQVELGVERALAEKSGKLQ